MITSRRGGRSEAVRQGAEHTLFVEGEKKILSIANERLFFDVANLVIIYIREELSRRKQIT